MIRHLEREGSAVAKILTVLTCLVWTSSASSQVSNTDLETERHFFDFLIGDWVVEERVTPEGVEPGGDDVYSFRPMLEGSGGIISDWYFNRGTPEEPNYTKGVYVSAYDEMTEMWTFYYVSPQNAMFFDSRKENGKWYFYHTFNIDGDEFLQRQSWTPVNDSTVVRTIENSRDGGETWDEPWVRRLKRRSGDG